MIIVCSSIIEYISTCILVAIKEEISRWIIIVLTREGVIRQTLDSIQEVSVDGGRIGRKIEEIGTVVWSRNRVIRPKRSDNLCLLLLLLLSPSKLCG